MSVYNVTENLTPVLLTALARLGLERVGLGLEGAGLGLVTAGLDYNTELYNMVNTKTAIT